MESPSKSFLSAPTPASSVLTPASTTSSRDPSVRTTATTSSTNNNTNVNTSNASDEPSPNQRRTTSPSGFVFPEVYDFPPFFTLQPNAQTRQAQMKRWSNLILDWCRYHRTYRLSLIDAAETPLFHNARLRKHMGVLEARAIVDYMAKTAEEGGGGRRAEWVPPGGAGEGSANAVGEKTIAWVWWRRPEEWATLIADWVEETAQKNTVLTLYELMHGEATTSQEFHGMDQDVMLKSLNVLVRRNKAQVFGSEDEKGVKFF